MNTKTNALINYIKERTPISEEVANDILSICKTAFFDKKHILLKEGKTAPYLYILEKGIARTFYYMDGKDVTSWIYPENIPFTSWYSFLNREPAFEYIELLSDAEIVFIHYDDLQNLYKKHPVLERFGRIMIETQFSFLDAYSKGYSFMSAKEKYESLLSFFPDLPLRVNLGYIASLLGISQETLSRIRKSTKIKK